MENITAFLNRRINAALGAGILENVIIDNITVSEKVNSTLDKSNLIEAKVLFDPMPGVKHYSYRIDKQQGDGGPGRQRHIHVYKNGEEEFAMNVDATAHDGYHQVKIPDEIVPFLQSKGFQIPTDNIIELKYFDSRGQLLLESVNVMTVNNIAFNVGAAIRRAQRITIVETNLESSQVQYEVKQHYHYQHVNKLEYIPQNQISVVKNILIDFLKTTGKYSDDVEDIIEGKDILHHLYVAWDE